MQLHVRRGRPVCCSRIYCGSLSGSTTAVTTADHRVMDAEGNALHLTDLLTDPAVALLTNLPCYICVHVKMLCYRYAYVLYDDVEKAKAVVDEYTEDPPMYVDRRLDVKFYREPVPEIPRGMPSGFFCTHMITVLSIEKLIKFLEAVPQIASVAMNVIKLPSQKMAVTSKDELLLGAGIRYVAVHHCIMRTVNKFLLA